MFDKDKYIKSLNTFSLGRRIFYFESIGSTNTFILQKDWKRGAIAVADEQTAGKGRSGKGWTTGSGSLAFSFAITHIKTSMLMPLNILIGFAVCDVLRKYAPVYLKWPNDCVATGRKISGILLETAFEGDKLEKLAIGIGINIYDMGLSSIKDIPITSLESLGVSINDISREKIIADILNLTEKYIDRFDNGDIDIKKLWPTYSAFYGKDIPVKINGIKKLFLEKGIDYTGSLIVEDLGGNERVITSEEVGYDFSR